MFVLLPPDISSCILFSYKTVLTNIATVKKWTKNSNVVTLYPFWNILSVDGLLHWEVIKIINKKLISLLVAWARNGLRSFPTPYN